MGVEDNIKTKESENLVIIKADEAAFEGVNIPRTGGSSGKNESNYDEPREQPRRS